jgi:hypothetical protein
MVHLEVFGPAKGVVMRNPRIVFALAVLSSTVLVAQSGKSTGATLAPQTTLPISFGTSVSADHSKPGDLVIAKTTQVITLSDGSEVRPGALVTGHVIAAIPFSYDKTPYAKQKESVLEIKFETLSVQSEALPLHVYVRAIADPVTSSDARTSTGPEGLPTTWTQIGGDQLTPSEREIRSSDGDVVGYNKRGGAYAHLIANNAGSVQCDGSNSEQPVSIFSASACGKYGFASTSLDSAGSLADPSHMTLSSTHRSPKVWKYSTALLEVLPDSTSASVQQ